MTVDPETTLTTNEDGYFLKIFQATFNIFAHIFIGIVVGACIIMAYSYGMPLQPIMLHIVLCAIGYQLLMAEAILSLSPDNGWSAVLQFRDKRRAHTILQVAGSVLAIAGTFIIIMEKDTHFNSVHGVMGFVAMVFTVVSLINGLTSLYAYEWRKYCPGNISKLTHICFGVVAFVAASMSLCFGFDTDFFRYWARNDGVVNTLIGFTAAFTFIVIINPLITFVKRSSKLIKS